MQLSRRRTQVMRSILCFLINLPFNQPSHNFLAQSQRYVSYRLATCSPATPKTKVGLPSLQKTQEQFAKVLHEQEQSFFFNAIDNRYNGKIWPNFMDAEFDPWCLKNLDLLRGQNNTLTNLDFFPAEVDHRIFVACLTMLQIHTKYFQSGVPQITNFEYDLLRRKTLSFMKKLQKDGFSYPEEFLVEGNKEIFEAYSGPDLISFFSCIIKNTGIKDLQFLFMPAINGVPFQVKYQDGFLQEAFATGLGSKQVDIIDLIKAMQSVPKIISESGSVIVSGHLSLTIQDFHALNFARRDRGQTPWMDTRSAIAYTLLHEEEPNKSLELKLKCHFDNYIGRPTNKLITYSDVLKDLTRAGFPTIPSQYIKFGPWDETLSALPILDEFPYESHGIAIKVNDLKTRRLLDIKDCCYKSIPNFYETTLDRVDSKVLPSGLVIAVLHVQPIQINKKIVSNFSINNQTHFERLNVGINDKVIISVSQRMLPQLLNLCKTDTSESVAFPSQCPNCNATLAKVPVDNEITACCSSHLTCAPDDMHDVTHFASIYGLHIPSLSKSIIAELIDKLSLTGVADIFSLSSSDYEVLKNIPLDVYNKLLDEIKIAKNTTLERFIWALNIPSVTYLMAEELAYAAGTIDRLMKMSEEDFSGLEYVDKKTAKNIITFFADKKKCREVAKLLNNGVTISEPNKEILELCYKKLGDYSTDDYKKVVDKIQDCNRNYSVTDFEFDLLSDTAKKIEASHPTWTLPKLPQQVAREVIKWKDPIQLRKTYSNEELKAWVKTWVKDMECTQVVVEPKVNGIASALEYKNGEFIRGVTKHDNEQGYNVTDYIHHLPNVPKKLKTNFTGMVRGELFIAEDDFRKLNREREMSGLQPHMDALSLVASSIKKKDKNVPVHSIIQFFGYHIIFPVDNTNAVRSMASQEDVHKFLQQLGLVCKLGVPFKVFSELDKAVNYMTETESRRRECLSNIDGMILRAPFLNEKKPLAYKFTLQNRSSRIQNVEFSVNKNGFVSGLVIIDPIKFSNGRTVSCVVCSVETISTLCEKDTISIKYSGGIVPVFNSVAMNKRIKNAVAIKMPENCPECHKKLLKKDNGSLQCVNTRCARLKAPVELVRFAKQMNIGTYNNNSNSLLKLLDSEKVVNIADLYKLSPEDLASTKTLSDEQIQNLLVDIEKSKDAPLEQLLCALNIREVGKSSAQRIAKNIPSLEELSKLTVNELSEKNIVPAVARSLVKYFAANKSVIDYLIKIRKTRSTSESRNTIKLIGQVNLQNMCRNFNMRHTSVIASVQAAIDAINKSSSFNAADLCALKEDKSTVGNQREREKFLYLLHSVQRQYKAFNRQAQKLILQKKGESKYQLRSIQQKSIRSDDKDQPLSFRESGGDDWIY